MKNLKLKSKALLIGFILSRFLSYSQDEVKIGTQTWTIKNLDVCTYRNGDVIPQVQDPNAWENLTTGAWCYYNHDAFNGTKYGKLYNWYAVSDPRGLAPNGYHIPTDDEWRKLADYLGGEDKAGKKMKSTSGWYNNGNGTNSSGFSGLPGGNRSENGPFNAIDYDGNWWSSTKATTYSVFTRHLLYFRRSALRYENNNGDGLSVRCIKD